MLLLVKLHDIVGLAVYMLVTIGMNLTTTST